MKQQSPNTTAMLDTLRRAVSEALERKRRLGRYAVTWEKGQIRVEGEDSPVGYGHSKANPMGSLWTEEDND